ncbi:MAG: carbon monoxide dehydrogenase [Cytophagales bacterium]|nr:MAG: carbon monoxide dehydrogenase [Cytophagales bacterium]
MQLNGSHTLNAPKEQVWAMLLDPETLTKIIPSLKSLEATESGIFKAICEVKMGPVSGTFEGTMETTKLVPTESFTLIMKQNSKIGNVAAEGNIHLKAISETETEMLFDGEANLSGLLARTGQRVLSGVANTLVGMFFKALEKEIENHATREMNENSPIEESEKKKSFWSKIVG